MNKLKIRNKTISENNPSYIIAELSGNHVGKIDIAMKTIKAMQIAGADAVKLQTYTADTITINSQKRDFQINQGTIWDGRTLYNLYQEAYTPWEWQPKLKKYAEELGMDCFSSPFDSSAVDFLEKMGVSAYKIASFEITDIPLIKYVASKGRPIILSTGIARLEDISLAINSIRREKNNQIALLKCTSEYPTPYENVNLNTIPNMMKKFNTIVGLSDHTLGIAVPIAAVAVGARIVEKHFILDRKLGGPDASFSLEPAEFGAMVANIRAAEQSLGKATYTLGPKQRRERDHRRSLYIVQNIKKGDILTSENVRSIRPGFGMHPKELVKILGKKTTKDAEIGDRMTKDLIHEKK